MQLARCKECKFCVASYWWKVWCNRGRAWLTKEILDSEYKHIEECPDWKAKQNKKGGQFGRLADALKGFKVDEQDKN